MFARAHRTGEHPRTHPSRDGPGPVLVDTSVAVALWSRTTNTTPACLGRRRSASRTRGPCRLRDVLRIDQTPTPVRRTLASARQLITAYFPHRRFSIAAWLLPHHAARPDLRANGSLGAVLDRPQRLRVVNARGGRGTRRFRGRSRVRIPRPPKTVGHGQFAGILGGTSRDLRPVLACARWPLCRCCPRKYVAGTTGVTTCPQHSRQISPRRR